MTILPSERCASLMSESRPLVGNDTLQGRVRILYHSMLSNFYKAEKHERTDSSFT